MVLLSATSCCEDCTDCSKERTKTKRLYDRTKSELNIANKEKNEKEKEIESLNKEIKAITGQLYDLRNKRKKDTAKINKLIGMLSSAIDREEILIQGLDSIISNRDYINAFYNGTDSVMGVSNETLFSSKLETQEFFYKLYNAKNEANDFVNDAKKFRDNMQESQQILAEIESERSREKIQELQRQLGQKQQALDAANQKIQQYNNEIIPNKDALITKLSEQVALLQKDTTTKAQKIISLESDKSILANKLTETMRQNDSLNDVVNIRPNIDLNVRKIVIKDNQTYEIPVKVHKRDGVKQSKIYTIYFLIGKVTNDNSPTGMEDGVQYLEPNEYIKFNGENWHDKTTGRAWAYNGKYEFEWHGQDIPNGKITIKNGSGDKFNPKQKEIRYTYLIFEGSKFLKGYHQCTTREEFKNQIK